VKVSEEKGKKSVTVEYTDDGKDETLSSTN
jgi:hypothetical protein